MTICARACSHPIADLVNRSVAIEALRHDSADALVLNVAISSGVKDEFDLEFRLTKPHGVSGLERRAAFDFVSIDERAVDGFQILDRRRSRVDHE